VSNYLFPVSNYQQETRDRLHTDGLTQGSCCKKLFNSAKYIIKSKLTIDLIITKHDKTNALAKRRLLADLSRDADA
jgi:hypothetical protein